MSTPSRSRSAMVSPGSSFSAKAGVTSSVIGIGHNVPLARRMSRQHALVVGPAHEALERREAAVHQQLEVAELALGQVPGLAAAGAALGRLGGVVVEIEIAQRPAVRVLESTHPRLPPLVPTPGRVRRFAQRVNGAGPRRRFDSAARLQLGYTAASREAGMAERYDAVIIGAGVIGASGRRWSWHGAAGGRSTSMRCRRPATARPAPRPRSSASTTRRCHGTALAYEGYHYWLHWAEHLGLPADAELAQYRETGAVVIKTDDNQELAPVCALMTGLGIPFEDWDAARLRRELPYLRPRSASTRRAGRTIRRSATATGEIAGAVLFPTCGYVNDPQLAARNLQQAAEARGARFRFNAKVARDPARAGGSKA